MGFPTEVAMMPACRLAASSRISDIIILEEHSSDEFCNKIYQKAIKANQYCLDLFLKNRKTELLTWEDIWKIFDIEEYHLVRDGNMVIETKNFIIYLHLPEFECEDSPKSIFRYYCNNPKMPEVPYVVLSECKTQIVTSRTSGYFMEDKSYDYISSGYYGYQIQVTRLNREKPIVKFDGINYEVHGKAQFGYRYDGLYKIYAIAESGNFLLK